MLLQVLSFHRIRDVVVAILTMGNAAQMRINALRGKEIARMMMNASKILCVEITTASSLEISTMKKMIAV